MTTSTPGSELRRLQALVGDLDAVVWEADAGSGKLTFVSEGAREILGFPPEAFTHEPSFWADHIHADDRESAVKEFMAGLEEGRPHDTEYRFLHRDGSVVWLRDIGHAVSDPEGTPLVVRGLLVDITQQKLAEERRTEVEQRYRRLVEQLPGMVYLEDADPDAEGAGKVTYVSPNVEEILGFTQEEYLADPAGWVTRLHPDDLPHMRRAYQDVVPTGAPYSAEYRMFTKDGRIVWIHDQAVLVRDPDGRPLFWQGVMLDITERIDAQRALEDEREQAAELRALDEMKNTFLQAVSHDLRTPLAAILGLAITLESNGDSLEPGDARDLASRIAANARKLDRLVTDLLDLDRLSRGIVEPNLESVDLAEVVTRVVTESESVSGREVTLDTQPVQIEVDPSKVERIVENLLANAARHTPLSTPVWVRVEPEPGGALLVVEDAGPGVAPEHRQEIFQPFRQGAGAPEHSPGVGVGLALVVSFAELHGGRAWVQERDGGGASFRVWLPASPPDPADASG